MALIGGQEYLERRVENTPDLFRAMAARAENFWFNHIEHDTPPAATCGNDVEKLFAADASLSIEADDALIALLDNFWQADNLRAQYEAQADAHKDRIKVAMGAATTITIDAKPVITWKQGKQRSVIDWQGAFNTATATLSPADAQAIIAAHTALKDGNRTFLNKKKEQ